MYELFRAMSTEDIDCVEDIWVRMYFGYPGSLNALVFGRIDMN